MKKSWVLVAVLGWSCSAQQITPLGPPTLGQVEQEVERQLHGRIDRQETSWVSVPPPERPTGESISVYSLRHKVPKAAQKSFERARKKSQSGDHAGAAAELEAAVRIDPLAVGAYNNLGMQYAYLRRPGDAKTAFERAVELDPEAWRSQYNLGLISMELGDYAGAAQCARRALQHASEEAQLHWLLGFVLCREEATKAEGMQHVRYAARTIKEAKQFLDWQQRH